MQNLLYFLFRYGYVILFICLEILCFTLIVRFNPHQSQIFVKSSNNVAGWIYDHYSSVTQYFGLSSMSRELAEENALLRRDIIDNQLQSSGAVHLKQDTASDYQYEILPARVINNRITGLDNFFTLNAGSDRGLSVGQGVIDGKGVVGILTDVNEKYARGISILNRDCRISVAIERNHFFGTLFWEGGNPGMAKMGDVPKHADLRIGDKVVTSGFSAVFPAGIHVGEVTGFDLTDGSNFYDIDIRLSTDMASLQYVYVIRNLFSEEQRKLEQ